MEGVGDLGKRKAEEGCAKLKNAVEIAEGYCGPHNNNSAKNRILHSSTNHKATTIPTGTVQECH